ncbi:MAG: PilZ domain-containing protein [Candidatus Omnitrophica bacterium]|nr:PilZ domain-containing protein [Candidatus Omnitrophota bacterium]
MDESIENPQEPLSSSFEEQRTFERFPSRFPAKFKDTRSDFGTDVYLRDASAGGVKITTKERLYLNDNINLEVELPDDRGTMTLKGEVVWVKPKDAETWNAGVQFHKIDFMDMWRPYKFVDPNPAV